jgi:hypothetical protein
MHALPRLLTEQRKPHVIPLRSHGCCRPRETSAASIAIRKAPPVRAGPSPLAICAIPAVGRLGGVQRSGSVTAHSLDHGFWGAFRNNSVSRYRANRRRVSAAAADRRPSDWRLRRIANLVRSKGQCRHVNQSIIIEQIDQCLDNRPPFTGQANCRNDASLIRGEPERVPATSEANDLHRASLKSGLRRNADPNQPRGAGNGSAGAKKSPAREDGA